MFEKLFTEYLHKVHFLFKHKLKYYKDFFSPLNEETTFNSPTSVHN